MSQAKSPIIWPLLLAALLSLGLTVLFLRGGWSLGLFLAVLLTEAAFLAWRHLPSWDDAIRLSPESAAGSPAANRAPISPPPAAAVSPALRLALAAIIADLGLCFALYDNIPLKALNFLVILVLIACQYLLESHVVGRNWDKPAFWIEILVSSIPRFWACLPDFGRSLARLFRSRRSESSAETHPDQGTGSLAAPAAVRPAQMAGRILLGLLLAVPVLLLAGSLLSSADAIFAGYASSLRNFLANLSLSDIFNNLLVALVLLPFIFSFLQSGRKRWRLLPPKTDSLPADADPAQSRLRIDKIVLITFLSCINLLYLVFAWIQLAYLTGAFKADLPADLTYAEYARSGFFELAFISVINLALILLTVKSAGRQGTAGAILRAESLLLTAGSLVQWASALFRMNMYVSVFGLTLMRFLVTAFMLLLFGLFILLLVKEFQPRFPLFKAFAAAALASLLILNHVNSDAWIAAHNARRFIDGSQPIDTKYYRELSDAAVPAMLQLTGAGDAEVAEEIARQLLGRYEGSLLGYRTGRWQRLNLSQERARTLLADNLERLRQLSPD